MPAFLNSVVLGTAGGANGGTTPAIDTTGGTLIVINVSWWQGNVAFSDSKGNTWTLATSRAGGAIQQRFAYCLNPIVGTGHTFTVTQASSYPSIIVQVFSGTAGYILHSEAGAGGGGTATPFATGTVTPVSANSVIVTGIAINQAVLPTGLTVSGSFAVTTHVGSGGVCFPGAMGYLIQSSASALNPSWSWTSGPFDVAAASLVFGDPVVPSPAWVTQVGTELVYQPLPTPVRVTQAGAELAWAPLPTAVWLTQAGVEVVSMPVLSVTQFVIEYAIDLDPHELRLSQFYLEMSVARPADLVPPTLVNPGPQVSTELLSVVSLQLVGHSSSVGIPAGSLMVGGYGDAGHCAFLSPDGATAYAQPASAPNPGTGLSSFARLSTGDIAQVGGNAPSFPTTGAGVWKASDLTRLSECVAARVGAWCLTADALGSWYSAALAGNILQVTKFNPASAVTATWDIAVPNGNPSWAVSSPEVIAVSGDGLSLFVRLHVAGTAWGGSGPIQVFAFSLAGAGLAVGALPATDDYGNIGYGSLLMVPGSGDFIVAISNAGPPTNGGVLRRYTSSGTLVWTAGVPTGPAPFHWQGVVAGVPGDPHFVAWAYTGDATSSNARYVWFDYATGTPNNTRNFAPDDGTGFEFDSQVVVLAQAVAALLYSASGLPPGLTLNPSTGLITGTPPLGSAGVYAVTATATDGIGSASQVFAWTVLAVPPPALADPGPQTSTAFITHVLLPLVGVSSTGATLTYSATGLPPGLTLNPTTGVITGIPTAPGTYPVTATVTDGAGSATRPFVWTVLAPPPIVITPLTIPSPIIDAPYSQQLTATGGDGGPYTFDLAGGTLPPGFSLSTGGLITGTAAGGAILGPTTWPGGIVDALFQLQLVITESGAGTPYTFTARATDGSAHTGVQAYTVTIQPGWGSAVFTVIEGVLPKCLRLQRDGLVVGKPMTVGNFTFTIQALQEEGATLTVTVTWTVLPA